MINKRAIIIWLSLAAIMYCMGLVLHLLDFEITSFFAVLISFWCGCAAQMAYAGDYTKGPDGSPTDFSPGDFGD